MRVEILTLFPGMVEPMLTGSILGRAQRAGVWSLGVTDIRESGLGKHRTVDDAPYGGGSGMVMRVDVVDAAIARLRRPESRVILLEAAGTPFTQEVARRLAGESHLVLVCGHYEGVDARVADLLVDESLSLGDFVMTGGEIAACAVVDAVVRLLPGALGNSASTEEESFSAGLLEYPQYTRPLEFRGKVVPEVLRSGDHARVHDWRKAQAEARTWSLRPDLAERAGLRDPAIVEAEKREATERKAARRKRKGEGEAVPKGSQPA